jgi:hypothetical protein
VKEEGSATLELVALSVSVLLPVIWVVVATVQAEAASFAARQAAREAARAFVTSDDVDEALARARVAAALAFTGQHLDVRPEVEVRLGAACDGAATQPLPDRIPAGSLVTACLRAELSLPFLDRVGEVVHLRASHTFSIDDFRSPLARR